MVKFPRALSWRCALTSLSVGLMLQRWKTKTQAASLVILAGTLASFNLPLEGIAVILGVDELMDMARTSVNLLGNCLATAVVARWEGVDLSKLAPAIREAAEAAVV